MVQYDSDIRLLPAEAKASSETEPDTMYAVLGPPLSPSPCGKRPCRSITASSELTCSKGELPSRSSQAKFSY
jgi:hypothetical protein